MASAAEEPKLEGFAQFRNYVDPEAAAIETIEDSQLQILDTRPLVMKTPISFLQELCVKKQMTPIYEMLASEGQVHEPTFIYRVIVGDMSAIGQGKSKKVAKHNAAKGLLEHIVARDLYREWLFQGETKEEALEYLHSVIPEIGPTANQPTSNQTPPQVPVDTSADVAIDLAALSMEDGELGGNPIGRLQEMCLGRRWPPPRYELIEESGMPHDKTFVITVYLGKFEQTGQGKSKKISKRTAAEKMLKFLHELPAHKQDEELALEDDAQEDEIDATTIEVPNLELDEQLAQLAAESENWGKFGNGFEPQQPTVSKMEELMKMDLTNEQPSLKLKLFLDAIAQEENWQIQYHPMERATKNGQYQCLVSFSETAVCPGTGSSKEEANYDAALHALKYLKVDAKT